MYSIDELKNILDFILSCNNIDITISPIKETVEKLKDIIFRSAENDFTLEWDVKNILVESFLNGDSTITEFTPFFIKNNLECINASIDRDINSIDYINNFTDDIIKKVKKQVVNSNYVLSSKSPNFLRTNFRIVQTLIKRNSKSIDGVNWEHFYKTDYYQPLLFSVTRSDYVLNEDSPSFLRKNHRVVMSSIKKDVYSGRFISKEEMSNNQTFGYLLLHDYDFSVSDLKNTNIDLFNKPNVLRRALSDLDELDFKNLKLSPEDKEKYIDRYTVLLTNALSNKPKIEDFKGVFEYTAEVLWKKHKYKNANLYKNVFGKICAELQRRDSFSEVLNNLRELLSNMKLILDDKYSVIEEYLKVIYDSYHGSRKSSEIESLRNDLSRLCALYTAKCKETFKKNVIDECNMDIKSMFSVKVDNPLIHDKQLLQMQREELKKLYGTDKKLNRLIREITLPCKKNKFAMDLAKEWIYKFINEGANRIDDLVNRPKGYDSYKRIKEAIQLIRRLSLGNIKYSDIEISTYKDIIKYDSLTETYYYDGPYFSKDDLDLFKQYELYANAFDAIKYELIKFAKTIPIPEEELKKCLESNLSVEELPFTDEFYEFSKDNDITLGKLMDKCINSNGLFNGINLLDDETYNVLDKLITNNGLIWYLLILNNNAKDKEEQNLLFNKCDLNLLIENINEIIKLSKSHGYKLNTITDYMAGASIVSYADEQTLSILGKDKILALSTNLTYTNEDPSRIIEIAKELLCKKVLRNEFTVPFVSGETNNYKFSMYDTLDDSYLLTGIYTHSCFTPDGTDNDFFHYCALDKNGFVIKITDKQDNLVARAAGFREGNSVYINQLRTVYDLGNNDYKNNSDSETLQIIEAFKAACRDIILSSSTNEKEEDKIENIFVTRSYAMQLMDSNVPSYIKTSINAEFMKRDNEDWNNFVLNTRNLRESVCGKTFKTDFDEEYSIICIASKNDVRFMSKDSLVFKDVKPVYKRNRNNIKATLNVTEDIISKVNRIKAIGFYLSRSTFEKENIDGESLVFLGDNWYMIYSNGIIRSYSIPGDDEAEIELSETARVFNKYLRRHPEVNEEGGLYKKMGDKTYTFTCKKDN